MSALYTEIREKRSILREIYGGMMTMADLGRELGTNPEDARKWAEERGLCTQIGKRIKAETDMVAKALVQIRGMV